jgi:hypothetical protein
MKTIAYPDLWRGLASILGVFGIPIPDVKTT